MQQILLNDGFYLRFQPQNEIWLLMCPNDNFQYAFWQDRSGKITGCGASGSQKNVIIKSLDHPAVRQSERELAQYYSEK